MAFKIIWSRNARDDLRDIVTFIAEANPPAAESLGVQLMAKVDLLERFPQIGRVVPEAQDESIREIILPPYRIIYKVLAGVSVSRFPAYGMARAASQKSHAVWIFSNLVATAQTESRIQQVFYIRHELALQPGMAVAQAAMSGSNRNFCRLDVALVNTLITLE